MTHQNADALRECPFCGGTELKVFDNCVMCLNVECGAGGPDLGHSVGKYAQAAAIEAWNRRAAVERTATSPWQPISTVTGDGPVDLWVRDPDGHGYRYTDCYRTERGGWSFWGRDSDQYGAYQGLIPIEYEITHWMQAPDGPDVPAEFATLPEAV